MKATQKMSIMSWSLLLLLLSTTPMGIASAESEQKEQNNETALKMRSVVANPQQSVRVEPNGKAQIDGAAVGSLSGAILVASVFGLNLSVDGTNAKVTGQNGGVASWSDIKIGDVISVMGAINPTTGVIVATKVVDRSLQGVTPGMSQKVEELLRRIAQLQEQLNRILGRGGTDTTAPVISLVSFSGITQTGAAVNWITNEAATSKVYFGTGSPLNLATASTNTNSSLVLNHSLALSGLSATTTYYVVVESRDASGNTATSSQQSFVTSN